MNIILIMATAMTTVAVAAAMPTITYTTDTNRPCGAHCCP